ncbi:S-adenosyl-L-methionine-dependent methyltransferases superfamily protein [Wolffia australiana]
MAMLNLAPTRRLPRQWRLLDVICAILFAFVILFLLLVFTSLGDAMAASGRRTLSLSSATDPRIRDKLIAFFDDAVDGVDAESEELPLISPCSAEDVDYLPCEDPRRSSHLSRYMNFYRERHCPKPGEAPLCLIPPPDGYHVPVDWPESLHKIWHSNMPYNKIAERKGHQGWMKEEGPYFIFPGGGTMFPDGAEQYIDKLRQYIPLSGGTIRTALDMGCGVASFGGFLLKEDILTLSFAPRDSHKSQIQFALERGIPALVAMLGTRRLPFPSLAFDFIHCSRCLIPFSSYNGTYFIEVDRLLRPDGYLVISGPPVQWPNQEKEWADLRSLAQSLCYEIVVVDGNTAIWKKPSGDSCLPNQNEFGVDFCSDSDDPSEAWYFGLKGCVTKLPTATETAVGSIPSWPDRLVKAPARAALIKNGLDLFDADRRRWVRRVAHYKNALDLKLGTAAVRNVMDMNAFFGGFAAALSSDPVWVMNTVPPRRPLTLDVIFDRGLIGVYHDWCEPFSSYPRTYDLIHVNGILSLVKEKRCGVVDVMVEMDRLLRPGGTVVVRESAEAVEKVAQMARAVRWTVLVHEAEPESRGREMVIVASKDFWKVDRGVTYSSPTSTTARR